MSGNTVPPPGPAAGRDGTRPGGKEAQRPGPSVQAGRALWLQRRNADRAGSTAVTVRLARVVRHLRLRGGALDGLTWSGAVDVGGRVCGGEGRWESSHVYVVTPEVIQGPGGLVESVAVPAEF